MVAETGEFGALERYRAPQGLLVTSLYLPLDRARDQARGYLKVFRSLRHEMEGTGESLPRQARQSLREDLDRMGAWLQTQRGFAAKGVAFFSCAADGFWSVLPLGERAGPLAVADRVTYRLPLLERAWFLPPGLVLLVGRQTARFLGLVDGGLVERGGFCNEVPQNVREGGWANLEEKRIDRHILDHLVRHVRQAVDALGGLGSGGAEWLVLAGPAEIRSLVRQELAPDWTRRLLEEVDVAADTAAADLEPTLLSLVARRRAARGAALLRQAEELAAKGQAALGARDAAAAVQRGAVRQLILRSGLRLRGYECSCGFVTPAAEPWRCVRCLGESKGPPREAAQFLADAALGQGAEVAFVRGEDLGEGSPEVAAVLRF